MALASSPTSYLERVQVSCCTCLRPRRRSTLQVGRRVVGSGFSASTKRNPSLACPRRIVSPRAAAGESGSGDVQTGAPLKPESPSGQLLRELLQSHPHLVSSAAEQQLELLAEQESGGVSQQGGVAAGAEKLPTGSELTLYKRIEEVRRQERLRAIEEVIYSLIVQKFIESGSPLLPHVPFVPLDPSNPLLATMISVLPAVETKQRELESVHSSEALEMVQEHMNTVLGGKTGGIPGGPAMEGRVLVGTSKMRLGQVYAASIMYGYFIRRVDQRFALEKSLRAMLGPVLTSAGPSAVSPVAGEGSLVERRLEEERRARAAEFAVEGAEEEERKESLGEDATRRGAAEGLTGLAAQMFAASAEAVRSDGEGEERKQPALRAYVGSFDANTLQNTVVMRSREGVSVVERHTQALFGKPEVVTLEGGMAVVKDDQSYVTVATLRRLILEAMAFGTFLWDVESYVDSRYKITRA